MHSSSYKDLTLTGKRLLVVGSGNIAVDIALAFAPDLATLGAAGSEPNQLLHAIPTILQRSPTPVLFPRAYEGFFAAACSPGPPLGPMGVWETTDFKMASVPWAMREASVRKMRNEAKTKANLAEEAQAGTKTEDIAHAKLEEVDEDTRRKNGLKANGFRVGEGPRDLGAAGAVYKRFAGYVADVWTFSDAVIEGRIHIKPGEIIRFVPKGVVVQYEDKEEVLECDAVIFATGYQDPREMWGSLLSPEIIDRAGPAWGLDEEGEFQGAYRPTGQPGLWYATGDFAHSRWGSKQLGLLLQGHQLGVVE